MRGFQLAAIVVTLLAFGTLRGLGLARRARTTGTTGTTGTGHWLGHHAAHRLTNR